MKIWTAISTFFTLAGLIHAQIANAATPMSAEAASALVDRCDHALGQALFAIKVNMLPHTEVGDTSGRARNHNATRPRGSAHARRIMAVNNQAHLWRNLNNALRYLNSAQVDTERGLGKLDRNAITSSAEDLRNDFAAILANEINNLDNQALRKLLGLPQTGNPVQVLRDPRLTHDEHGRFVEIPKEMDVWFLHTSGRLPTVISQLELSKHDPTLGQVISASIANAMAIRFNNRNKVAIPTVVGQPNPAEFSSAAAATDELLNLHLANSGPHYQGIWQGPGSTPVQWETGIHPSPEAAQAALDGYRALDPRQMRELGIDAAQVIRVTPKLIVLRGDESSVDVVSSAMGTIEDARNFIAQNDSSARLDPTKDLNSQLKALGSDLRVVPIWNATP